MPSFIFAGASHTDVVVDLNESVTLSCTNTGGLNKNVLWKKSGKVLTDQKTLVIHSAKVQDAGNYTCECQCCITNSITTLIIQTRVKKEIAVGHDVTLNCQNGDGPIENIKYGGL